MKKLSIIIAILVIGSNLFAFDPAYHMYLGSQTFDVWQDFDPDFYESVTGPHPNIIARKFYYIGLTLPDMFDFQDGIANLIDSLYGIRDEIGAIHDRTPVYIETITRNNVQAQINFLDPPPNQNLEKLWRMANWAKIHQPDPHNRALVYGAVMHVIHDLFAHQVLQPSRFGYGYAIQSDSMHADDDPIFLGEVYHELFTPTYIPNWDFIIDELYRARVWRGGNVYSWANPGVGYFEFMRTYNLAGQVIEGWQDLNFDDVETFVNAANAVNYHTQNLTRERLEAYIHGWGITMFLLYGYRKDGVDLGGVLAHPSWTFSNIFDYYWNMGDDYFRVSQVPHLCDLFSAFGMEGILYWFGGALFDQSLDKIFQEWINKIIEFYLGNHSWPWYLQTTTGIDIIWDAIPYQYKSDTLTHLYYVGRREIEFWNNYASVMKPNIRSSYSQENADAMAFKPLIKATLDNGYTYYDYDGYTLSRKAGLSGGMHTIPDAYYYRQPGISKMRFQDGNTPIFAPTPIAIEGAPKYLNFNYKIVIFGSSKLQIWGKGEGGGGTATLLNYQYHSGPQIITSSFSTNAQSAVNQGHRELSYIVNTRKKTSPWDYKVMLDSDYRNAYNSHSEIYNNQYYQSVLKSGDPTRSSTENPIDNPTLWWPYVLCIYPAAAAPSNLRIVNQPTMNSVTIQWDDNSGIEEGFKIARKVDDGNWNPDYATVGTNVTQYTDEDIAFLHKYSYKVRAYDGQGLYSEWSNVVEFTSGKLVQSNYPKMTAYNNGPKVAKYNNNVYVLYVRNHPSGKPYYACCLRSTDDGLSFLPEEIFQYGQGTGWHGLVGYPTIRLDNNGTPHVVCEVIKKWTSSAITRRYYHYYWFDDQGWHRNRWALYKGFISKDPYYVPTEADLQPSSFVTKGDSGFIALIDDGDLKVVGFSLFTTQSNIPSIIVSPSSGFAPAIGYDPGGRLVVAYPTWFGAGHDNDINFIYRDANGNWSNPIVIADYAGIPSLYTQEGRVYIGFQNQDGHDSVACATLQWQGGNYNPPSISFVTQVEPEWQYPLTAHPYLIDDDLIVWRSENDIWYSLKNGAIWTNPVNISDTPDDTSSYPHGVAFGRSNRKLFSLWTEKVGNDYYLVRKIFSLPNNYVNPIDGVQQGTEMQYTGPFCFESIYPNPTKGIMKIRFMSPDQRRVTVNLYDVTGRVVKNIFDGKAKNGLNEIRYSSKNLASGVYFVRLITDDKVKTEKVIFYR